MSVEKTDKAAGSGGISTGRLTGGSMSKIGIVMGSDSDIAKMSKAAEILEEFGIEYEICQFSVFIYRQWSITE